MIHDVYVWHVCTMPAYLLKLQGLNTALFAQPTHGTHASHLCICNVMYSYALFRILASKMNAHTAIPFNLYRQRDKR